MRTSEGPDSLELNKGDEEMEVTETLGTKGVEPAGDTTLPAKKSLTGQKRVGPVGIGLLIAYVIILSLIAVYGLISFLPGSTSTVAAVAASSPISFFIWTFQASQEVRLFITVALAGLLGSLVHVLRSLYWYIGNRALTSSWVPKYVLIPIVGAVLSLAFYLVIRGGFFSGGPNVDQTNPYGFMALGVLIGMFSEQAVLKLKDVAETLLSKPPKGADSTPQEGPEETPKPEGGKNTK
ncbi:MAG: hypothetical protein M1378_01755 [Bacteroidetes bacterium]|nr:hypothetical protein [Bacteroidota bacterium]